MLGFLKQFFNRKPEAEIVPERNYSDEVYEQFYLQKKEAAEHLLGRMHDVVGHALIPFAAGGAVDMYYFTDHRKGTALATMGLIEPDGSGPRPNFIGTYELLAFTRHSYTQTETRTSPFEQMEQRLCGIFTTLGSHSAETVLKPGDLLDVPGNETEMRYLLLDAYEPDGKELFIGNRRHHFMLCMEIFRSESEYAREHGSDELLNLLEKKGYYPYSDLDREPLV